MSRPCAPWSSPAPAAAPRRGHGRGPRPWRRRLLALALLALAGELAAATPAGAAAIVTARDGRTRPQPRALAAVARRLVELAPKLRDPEERSTALDWAAKLLARAGDPRGAHDAWDQAVAAVTEPPGACPAGAGALLAAIAVAQARLGEPQIARATLERAHDAALQCPGDFPRLLALQALRSAWTALGEADRARALRGEMLRLIETSREPAVRGLQGPALGSFLGDPDDPADLMRRLKLVPPGPEHDFERAEVLGRLAALALAAAGPGPGPGPGANPALLPHLDVARTAAIHLADPLARQAAVQALAVAEAKLGRFEAAEQLIRALPDAGPLSPDQAHAARAGLLIDLADALAGAGRPTDAHRLLGLAEQQLDPVASPTLRGQPLARIALARAAAGDPAGARQAANRAAVGFRYPILLDLADERARAGDHPGAGDLLDAARADLEHARRNPPPPDPEEIAPDDPALRQRQLANAARAAEARLAISRGQLDDAEAAARAIDDEFARREALAGLALSRLHAGDLDTALACTDRIPRLDERRDVLIRLAADLDRGP